MNHKIFLSQLSQDEILKLSTDEIQQRILAEQEFINKQPHKNFLAATHGSKTKNGGLVKASINQRVKAEGHLIAAVGDEVIYQDGSSSKIISGAGEEGKIEGFEVAPVGSRLENGDEIIESLQSSFVFRLYADRAIPEGFLNHD
ncbi:MULTISPECIES: PAAR domain-containing protein [Acinetobacter]|uniref:PAAR domain-containing protein n=1 Tax=Acinetobacter TaxID=469 RepID=UPI000CFF65F9|nr:PAAR domain-containing protein [Acinetobacter sp. MYb10]QLD61868.1 PAAR domain-containing protein [Acinetobacter sp. MYb10]